MNRWQVFGGCMICWAGISLGVVLAVACKYAGLPGWSASISNILVAAFFGWNIPKMIGEERRRIK